MPLVAEPQTVSLQPWLQRCGRDSRGKETVVSVAVERAESRDGGDAITLKRIDKDVYGNNHPPESGGPLVWQNLVPEALFVTSSIPCHHSP